MGNPMNIPVKEQQEKISVNSQHVVKSLEYAAKKLVEYYQGAAELNGMSYNRMLAIHTKIEEALHDFEDTNTRVQNNITNKVKSQVQVPKRKSTTE